MNSVLIRIAQYGGEYMKNYSFFGKFFGQGHDDINTHYPPPQGSLGEILIEHKMRYNYDGNAFTG